MTDRVVTYVQSALGRSMLQYGNRRRVFVDSNDPSVRVFVAMAQPHQEGKYWFWVKCYAVPLLDDVQNSFVLFGCKDRRAYYLLPWHEYGERIIAGSICADNGALTGSRECYSCPIINDVLRLRADLRLPVGQHLFRSTMSRSERARLATMSNVVGSRSPSPG